jgi:hypothetical protein
MGEVMDSIIEIHAWLGAIFLGVFQTLTRAEKNISSMPVVQVE